MGVDELEYMQKEAIMANLKQWILRKADGEEIEAVVIGHIGGTDYLEHKQDHIPDNKKGVVMSWEEAQKLLDYEFDDSFAEETCHAVWVWTPNNVIAIAQCECYSYPYSIPRNPLEIFPTMVGG